MKFKMRLAAVVLTLTVFSGLGITAYAKEIPTTITEETTQTGIETSTSIPEDDTFPHFEDLPAVEEQETKETPTVYNIKELQAAIEAANDGDTILIGEQITCGESVAIGNIGKRITLAFADEFSGNAMFYFFTHNGQEFTLQNLILNGTTTDNHSAYAVKVFLSSALSDTQGSWNFAGVTFEKFHCDGSVVAVFDARATFSNCHFKNNYGKRSGGVEIHEGSCAAIVNCSFSDNQSGGDGGAIRCRGKLMLTNSTITGNTALNNGTVKNGGGIYIAEEASCEVMSCTITGNNADLGGGIACMGTLKLCDTLICGNTAQLGGSDIRGIKGATITVEYTDNMGAVYAENSPVGFYKDDFKNVFNSETNAEFVGETIMLENNSNNNFGVKFIFKADLPVVTPAPADNSDNPPEDDFSSEDEIKNDDGENEDIELPIIPVVPPVIEVDSAPVPTPSPIPVPTPEPTPIPTQPIDPPEESEKTKTEEIPPSELDEVESEPIIGEETTTQDTEETPSVTATDNNVPVFEEAEQDKPSVQDKSEDEPTVDVPAPIVDSHTETEESSPPIDNETQAEITQPEQEEQPITVAVNDNKEKSTPWGIIITAATLLSASGAIWLIKRKH